MIIPKEFNGFNIDFDVFLREKNAMVNATQMAKVFDKKVENFTRIDSTQIFIKECLKNANKRFLGIDNEEDLIISKQKSGTWMHRVLALKFAAWLNPAFDLWVFLTIEELLFGSARRMDQSFKRSLEIKNEMKELKEKENPSGEDFKRYLNLENELKSEKNERTKETVQKVKSLQRVLFTELEQE